MGKRKLGQKQAKTNSLTSLQNILSNERADFIFGLLFLAVAAIMFIAFVSFLRTGQADQSILENMRPSEWQNEKNIFSNCCHSFGAIVSYFFITLSFGLSSFVIPIFMIAVGMKLMGIFNLNIWKWFFSLTVVMVWSSVAFAKFLAPIMRDEVYNPGGNHGLYCMQHLENLIGSPGLTITLVVTAIIFLTFISSQTIILIRKMLNPVKYLTSKVKITVTNSMDANYNQEEHTTDVNTQNEDDENELKHAQQEQQDAQEPRYGATVINLTDANTPELKKAEDETADGKQGDDPATEDGGNATTITLDPKTPVKNDNYLDAAKADGKGSLLIEVAKGDEKANASTLNVESQLHTPINPKEPFTRYKYPTLDLLKKYDDATPTVDMDEINSNNARIVEVLNSFGVGIKEIKATVGPTITLYEVTPAEGVRISKIRNLEDDIALSLSALGIRIIAPIPGKGTVGIEVPNKKKNIVSMESILNSRKFKECKYDLPVALGKTITNDVYIADLTKMPHLLVAGATGQGKSVGLNAIITSLLYKKHPNELKFVLVDPKKVEFSVYNPIADHFMASLDENVDEPIITDTSKVVKTLNGLCALMDNRYGLLKDAGARNIKEYNEKYLNHKLNPAQGHEFMPYIVVIIDEFGDLIMTAGKDIERPIARIAQLARAVGIHMVIATQRPTTNIITGTIKANFPGRMAFRVSAMIDSRTILDRPGANQLIGKGDMLIINGSEPIRVQCAFVDTPEVERVNKYISEQSGPVEPMPIPEPVNPDGGDSTMAAGGSGEIGSLDPYFEEAARSIVSTQQGSTSMIQRRFSIGYNRAGRLMDQLEKAGIVGTAQGSKPREVLISDENQLNTLLANLKK